MEHENFDKILVKLVRRNSNIYDRSHADFKNKNAKENTWASIARAVTKSKEECIQRWNGLRNRYAMERRKVRIESKPSTWPLYPLMTFLDSFMLPRTSYGCYKSSSNNTSENSFTGHYFEESNEDTEDSNPTSPYDYYPSPMDRMIDPVEIKEEPEEIPLNDSVSLKGLGPKINGCSAEDAFGTTVGLMLKNIKERKKRRKAQLEIMQILCNYSSGSDCE